MCVCEYERKKERERMGRGANKVKCLIRILIKMNRIVIACIVFLYLRIVMWTVEEDFILPVQEVLSILIWWVTI